jgi:hypothetical protein
MKALDKISEKLTESRREAAAVSALAIILMIAIPLVADRFLVEEQEINFPASATIVESANNSSQLGIATGEEGLAFGRISYDTNSTRFVNLETNQKTYLNLKAEGNISQYLKYDKTDVVSGSENISVEIVPQETGNYTGNLVISAKYSKGGLGELWLGLSR